MKELSEVMYFLVTPVTKAKKADVLVTKPLFKMEFHL
ncbi:hypothetical protein ES703_85203 [subsurface metagenome]